MLALKPLGVIVYVPTGVVAPTVTVVPPLFFTVYVMLPLSTDVVSLFTNPVAV